MAGDADATARASRAGGAAVQARPRTRLGGLDLLVSLAGGYRGTEVSRKGAAWIAATAFIGRTKVGDRHVEIIGQGTWL